MTHIADMSHTRGNTHRDAPAVWMINPVVAAALNDLMLGIDRNVGITQRTQDIDAAIAVFVALRDGGEPLDEFDVAAYLREKGWIPRCAEEMRVIVHTVLHADGEAVAPEWTRPMLDYWRARVRRTIPAQQRCGDARRRTTRTTPPGPDARAD